MKSQSYFTFNSNEGSLLGIHSWCFRDYGEYVYFTLPEYIARGKGVRRGNYFGDDFCCCLGRIHKKTGKKQIMRTIRGYELGKFSVYDSMVYVWGYEDAEDEEGYSILGIDTVNNEGRVVSNLKTGNKLEYVLKNKKGSLVYLLHGDGSAYIEQADGSGKKIIDGIEWWDGAILGYNEHYLYYNTLDEQYCCLDLDTMDVINISVEEEEIIAERRIYMIDCKTDIIYIENPDELVAFNWLHKEVWGVKKPKPFSALDSMFGIREWFNGEYWIRLLSPNGNTPEGISTGMICYNQDGEEIGSSGEKYRGYPLSYHVLFSFADVICAGLNVVNIDSVERISGKGDDGDYDWVYGLYRLSDKAIERGMFAFREYFC